MGYLDGRSIKTKPVNQLTTTPDSLTGKAPRKTAKIESSKNGGGQFLWFFKISKKKTRGKKWRTVSPLNL